MAQQAYVTETDGGGSTDEQPDSRLRRLTNRLVTGWRGDPRIWRRGIVVAVIALLLALVMLLHSRIPNRYGNLGSLTETFLPWLGLLIPLAEQAEKLASKWARPGLEVVAEALAPSADAAQAKAAAERLAARKPDLVAMDCMSYTPATKEQVKPALGVPALLAITATGRVLREMLD